MNVVADILIAALVFATLAQAWSWLGAYAGVVSLGHAVFFGIGAYAVAVSNVRGGSPWYGALGGGLCAVLVAAVLGGLTMRGRGYAFTAITLALGALAEPFVAAQHWIGAGNAFVFPVHLGFLNLQFAQKWPYVLLAFCVFTVAQALTVGLRGTRLGQYLRAVRTNPIAARSSGIAARPPRLLCLVVSAFVTSVVGSFFAQYVLAVDPHTMFAPALSFDIALIGIIAGPASLWGAPLVALVYILVARVVPLHPSGFAGEIVLVMQGALILALAHVFPEGFLRTLPSRRPAIARSLV